MEIINIYCDESCHLENDQASVMVLGAVWCPLARAPEISTRLREIKQRHGVLSVPDLQKPRSVQFEMKWTKVSPSKNQLSLDWIDYFFDDDDLHFRGIVIDKSVLDHEARQQTHDDWYYKMLYRMLEVLIDPRQQYRIYLDIKDTRSEDKRSRLEDILRTKNYDFDSSIIDRVQLIRSHESELLQLTDLLIGAIGYHHRIQHGDFLSSGGGANTAKLDVIRRIRQRSRKTLERSTLLREPKFNLFLWNPSEVRG